MPDFFTTFGPLRLQTFTLALALAIAASICWSVYRIPARRSVIVDVCLGALVLGVIGARAGHVLLNWEYFAFNSQDILRIDRGGLDWHGGLLGALAGLHLVARWRGIKPSILLDTLTLALPLITLAGWWGCMAANCAYGAEVATLANHPPLVVAEMPDVYGIPAPRYNTPLFGLLLGGLALVLTLLMLWRGWLVSRRFWLVLALLSAGMFGIGFLRADFAVMIAGLRADQWLDLIVLFASLVYFLILHVPAIPTNDQSS